MRRIAPLALGFALVLIATVRAQEPASPLTAEERELFAWFDQLGFPSLKGAKLVAARVENAPGANGFLRWPFPSAFLLEEDEQGFTIFCARSLETRRLRRKGTFGDGMKAVAHHEPAAARDVVDELLRESRYGVTARAIEPLEVRGQAFVLARGLAAIGQEALAHELCQAIASMSDRWHGRREEEEGQPRASLRQVVARELARARAAQLTWAFETPEVPRRELLTRAELFVAQFPESEHAAWGREVAARLRAMLAEEEARAALPPDLTPEGTIAELVFRLRDQEGAWRVGSWSAQRARPDLYADPAPVCTAMPSLAAIRTAAVPRLIAALEDRNYTRTVYHFQMEDALYPKEIVRVSDVAAFVLEEIAAQDFTKGALLTEEARRAVVPRVHTWWEELNALGADEALRRAAARGETDAALRLLREQPTQALGPILAGARASEPSNRAYLTGVAILCSGEALVPYLLDEVRAGPTLECRMAAAVGLDELGREEGAQAMLEAWRARPKGWAQDPVDDHERKQLLGFLVTSQEQGTVAALRSDVASLPVRWRWELLDAVGGGPFWWSGRPHRLGLQREGAAAEVEALLGSLLEDSRARAPLQTHLGSAQVLDPRVCDAAAHALSARWPDRHRFDAGAPFHERERRRVELINAFRARTGEAALPLPEPPPPTLPGPLTVQRARVVEGSAPVPDRVAALLAKAVGQPLAGEPFVELFVEAVRAKGDEIGQVRLEAHRAPGAGLELLLSLTTRSGPPRQGYGWSVSSELSVGDADPDLDPGSHSVTEPGQQRWYADFCQHMDERLGAAGGGPLAVRLAVSRD